jgi:hypothetical protein
VAGGDIIRAQNMKFWGLIVAFIYVFILAALFPARFLIFIDTAHSWEGWKTLCVSAVRGDIDLWYIFAIALIAQGALLSVPVEIAGKRPVTKRTVVPLIIATSFMMMLLVFGSALVSLEVFKSGNNLNEWRLVLFCVFIWGFWALVFFRWSRKMEPLKLIERQCRWLYRGSILELLVAVPSHIYVRQRHECCAGIGTFVGIACGIAVMFFSFGPGVFFLFIDRLERLKNNFNCK